MSTSAKQASALNADSAQKILDADLKNIVAKVAGGKPLTARERKMIIQASTERREAKSVKELCALLGIKPAKYYSLKKRAGSPDGKSLEEWREFLSVEKLTAMQGKPMSPEEIAFLRGRLLAEKAAREKVERKLKELKLEREVGGFVAIEVAQAAITRVLEPINRLLDGIPKAYSMRVNPTDSDFAEEMLREMVEDLKLQITQSRGEKISKRKGVK